MSRPPFHDFIIENDIIGFFGEPVTLKSGRKSHFYVNWRDATNDAWLLDCLTDYLCDFLRQLPFQFDTLYGVPEGATKSAVIASMKLARTSSDFQKGSHVIAMGRAAPKPHGDPKDKYFIGAPRGRTLVLEDTTTTGGSLIRCLDELLAAGVEVVGAVGLTDRMEKRDEDGLGVGDALRALYGNKISYHALSEATDLIPRAIRKHPPDRVVTQGLVEEFRRYGVKPLNL